MKTVKTINKGDSISIAVKDGEIHAVVESVVPRKR